MQKVFIGSIKSKRRPKEIQEMLIKSKMVVKAKKLYPKKGKIKKGFAIFDVLLKKNIPLERLLSRKFNLDGEELFLTEYLSDQEVQKRNYELRFRKLHISNLPDTLTEDEFRKMFEVFGVIETAYLSRDRYEKKKKQLLAQGVRPDLTLFGFVTYRDTSSATRCFAEGNKVLGVDFEITKFIPKSRSDQLEHELEGNIGQSPKKGHRNLPSGTRMWNTASDNSATMANSGHGRTASDSNSRQKGRNTIEPPKGLARQYGTKSKGVDPKPSRNKNQLLHNLKNHQETNFKRSGQVTRNNNINYAGVNRGIEKRRLEPLVFDRLKQAASRKIDICRLSRNHRGRNVRYNFKYPIVLGARSF